HHFQTEYASHLLFVDEIRIAELLKPCKVVKGGVIDAIRATRADISRGYSEMLQKGSVVGAAAEIPDRDIGLDLGGGSATVLLDCFGGRLRRGGAFRLRCLLPRLVDRASFRTGNNLGHIAKELLEAGDRGTAELGTGDCDIHIEVRR